MQPICQRNMMPMSICMYMSDVSNDRLNLVLTLHSSHTIQVAPTFPSTLPPPNNNKKVQGSSALNPGAVFFRFFTVAFLLFLTHAGGSYPAGPTFNIAGQSLTFN